MEIGDLNEFEFDLSDVAAFESVEDDDDNNNQNDNDATTTAPAAADPNANANACSNGNGEPQQEHPHIQLEGQLPHQPQPPPALQQQHQLQQLQQLQLQQHHQQQLQPQSQQQPTTISLASGAPTGGKILLVPINSKPGAPGYTFLLSPLTMAGNKKQIIQLAPSSSAQANKQQQQLQLQQQQLHQQQQLQQQQLQQQQQQHQQQQLQLQQQNLVPKRKPCNCTKSQCLKLYCDCFANGEFCSGCNCTNCFNSLSKEKERQKAISSCLERNPEAFRPKIGKAVKLSVGEPAPDSIERRHTKGCNCKRSGCLKNYCECYEAKILCSNLCKCCGCKNYEESFERKSLMQLANSASESARGILKNLLPTNNNSSTGKEFTKCFITNKVIHASLMCLLQSAQQAEKDGIPAPSITNLIQVEMGKCLRMIVDSAAETSSPKKR